MPYATHIILLFSILRAHNPLSGTQKVTDTRRPILIPSPGLSLSVKSIGVALSILRGSERRRLIHSNPQHTAKGTRSPKQRLTLRSWIILLIFCFILWDYVCICLSFYYFIFNLIFLSPINVKLCDLSVSESRRLRARAKNLRLTGIECKFMNHFGMQRTFDSGGQVISKNSPLASSSGLLIVWNRGRHFAL